MVYGFVKQSGGHIQIYSEVGQGTTVRLYLPPAPKSGGAARPMTSDEPTDSLRRGHETILIVEDDARVRRVGVARLEALGYQVSRPSTGTEALATVGKHPAIRLLFH